MMNPLATKPLEESTAMAAPKREKSDFERLTEGMAAFRVRKQFALRRGNRCPNCGRFMRYDAYYDKWICDGHG